MTSQRSAVTAMLRALNLKPHTISELAGISGLSANAVSGWLKAMRAGGGRLRLVMIGDWRADALGRRIVPAYTWGLCGEDMAKPAALTRTQITARHRAKKALQD